MSQASLDLRALTFSMLLSAAAALVFGLAPALERLRGEDLNSARVTGRAKGWFRPALVSLQLSISVVLLTGAGLFLLSLWRFEQARLGFAPEAVVTGSFLLPEQRYASGERQIAFFHDLERKLDELPGFVAAAITDSLPPGGDPRSRPFFALIGGGNSQDKGSEGTVKWRYVTPGYFGALSIPIRRGRAFSSEDRAAGRHAIIVSESLARRLYGEADPIGKQLRLEEPFEIIGVAADVRNAGFEGSADPEFYVLRGLFPTGVWQNQRPPFGWRRAMIVVRSTLSDGAAIAVLQAAIHELDPAIAVVTGTLSTQVRQYFARPRFQTALLSVFGLIGLALAAVGLYGLTSFLAAQRTREVGVRIALGATPANIAGMMMREGMTWTCIGVLLGLLASAGLMRSIRTVLFEVEPLDARVFGAAIALLAVVAIIGAWIPSARASRIDPMEALRHE